MTTLRRDIAPDPEPETDQCGYCGTWYIVRDDAYRVCPHHDERPGNRGIPELSGIGQPRNLYYSSEIGE